ncbi:MAG: EFR1 family ferrodoxin [Bacteroidales bacterium]|nr:EFR1 family ferrodoxin [Bacteroidales bacterium]
MDRRNALKIMLSACTSATFAAVPVLSSCTKQKEQATEKIKRLIFFFSATGNSLYVSKRIGGDDATILSIAQEIHNENPVYEAEEIGFVFPTYCFTAPAIVQDFIARSSFKADYFFGIATYGAHTTKLPELFQAFTQEHGITMNYISSVKMVDTYLPFFDQAVEMAADKHTEEMIQKAIAGINAHENYILPVTEDDYKFYDAYFNGRPRDKVKPALTRSEKIVYSTDDCIGCGICVSVCPHGSWKIVDKKSVANGECENCLACVQNCPRKAISIIPAPMEPQEEANRSVRYRNPNISLAEIIKANQQHA